MKDPAFVAHFKDRKSAIQALHIIVAGRENGLSNNGILKIPFFLKLFNPEYVADKTKAQLEWKLKNIMRDLGAKSFEKLHPDFHEFKMYFESQRRIKNT